MEKAVIISVVAILALLGIYKIVEWLESVTACRGKNPSVLFYKIKNDSENAELIIRSLAVNVQKLSCAKRNAVYIVTDGLDSNTLDICKKTAQQLPNVFIGEFADGEVMLEEIT